MLVRTNRALCIAALVAAVSPSALALEAQARACAAMNAPLAPPPSDSAAAAARAVLAKVREQCRVSSAGTTLRVACKAAPPEKQRVAFVREFAHADSVLNGRARNIYFLASRGEQFALFDRCDGVRLGSSR